MLLDLTLVAAGLAPVLAYARAWCGDDTAALAAALAAPLDTPAWWALLGSLSLLYVLHAFIWNYPNLFTMLSAPLGPPVAVFGKLEIVGKVQQIASLVVFWGRADARAAVAAALDVGAPGARARLAIAVALVAVGQGLNVAVYRAIGEAGVYYGFKVVPNWRGATRTKGATRRDGRRRKEASRRRGRTRVRSMWRVARERKRSACRPRRAPWGERKGMRPRAAAVGIALATPPRRFTFTAHARRHTRTRRRRRRRSVRVGVGFPSSTRPCRGATASRSTPGALDSYSLLRGDILTNR